MTWIKLDDDFNENAKFLRAGPVAGYMHIAAIAWSRHNLTDGVIPEAIAHRLVDLRGVLEANGMQGIDVSADLLIDRLQDVGLWHKRDDGDYEIHDYLEHQDSREKVERERDRKRAGMQGLRATRQDVAPPQDRHNPAGGTLESREGRVESREGITEKGDQLPTESAAQTLVKFVDHDPDQLAGLFDYWRERCGHPRALLSTGRRRKIASRLKEGATVEEIRKAIDGAALNAYVNDAGVRYDDIELICRNREKLDLFIARAGSVSAPDERTERRERGAAALQLLTGGQS
jgi:hypothetical protein